MIQELWEQIQDGQEVRQNLSKIRQEIKEKRRTYWRGAITGAASVMAVLLIVLLIGIYSGAVVIGGKGGTGGSQTVTASDGDLLSKDVINKLDNLADQINADYYEDVEKSSKCYACISHGSIPGSLWKLRK